MTSQNYPRGRERKSPGPWNPDHPGRFDTETVTEDHKVSETLRKEQIDDPNTELPGTRR